MEDINNGGVFLIYNDKDVVAGTGTKHGEEMNRVFILPGFQGKGYGKRMMNYLEGSIGMEYDEVYLDSSLPAFNIYLKRGYQSVDYFEEVVGGNQVLCYHRLKKSLPKTRRSGEPDRKKRNR